MRVLNRGRSFCVWLVGFVFLTLTASVLAQSPHQPVGFHGDYAGPYFPDGEYLPDIPTPESALGYQIGSQPVTHAEVINYFEQLAEASDRMILKSHGETYEGRRLIHAIISSPENLARLDEIKEQIGKLADPRRLASAAAANEIIGNTPAVCWMGYCIHGDELSGTDAGVLTAYQLAAGSDTLTGKILQNLVIVLDPLENPDGRDRYIAQLRSLNGAVPNHDARSLQHNGFWPYGRTNHYLFDLNRDWFAVVHPETQGRVETIIEWHPQLVVDAHEMGSMSNFLFSPPREPYHPNMTANLRKWWDRFAADQAAAFDRYGWRYYTGDWHEEWFPGFTSSWAGYTGAVGILYEQAGVAGSQVKQRDGATLSFGETVHHQFISSIANMSTAAYHREQLLRDYYTDKSASLAGKNGAFLIVPDDNPGRMNLMLAAFETQGIEVQRATQSFPASARSYWNTVKTNRRFPSGTLVIPFKQPQRNLIEATLGFDHRIPDSMLVEERKSLLKGRGSKMYEVSAWSPLLAYGLDAYLLEGNVGVSLEAARRLDIPAGTVPAGNTQQGYTMRVQADHEITALVELFKTDLVLRAARKEFAINGQTFPRGSIVISRKGNSEDCRSILEEIAAKTGAEFFALATGLAEVGPDMGSGEYGLLASPKIALAAGNPAGLTSCGSIRHMLDQRLGTAHSMLDISRLGYADLSPYNVLILPGVWGGPGAYERTFGKGGIAKLKDWIKDGGTLIAIGTASAFCADTSVGISQVRQRRQVLGKLAEYIKALEEEHGAEDPDISGMQLWETPSVASNEEKPSGGSPGNLDALKVADEKGRLFRPRGAFLRVDLDEEEWLSFGMSDKVPALMYDFALLSKRPVRTVGRFGDPQTLRLSGLLWPEGRERWANTAYITRESMGKGQVILFAGEPIFRGYCHGTERLLINAILYGPGLGARSAAPY